MDISFIIVNYNLSNEVQNCINSIIEKVTGVIYEIIVVDNNSKDAASHNLDKVYPNDRYPYIHIFFLTANRGFGSGCNFGASKASAKTICFLNPDTIIEENIFFELIKYLKSDENIVAICPQSTVKRYFDFSAGVFPNLFLEILNIIFLGRHIEALYIYLKKILGDEKPFSVDWILGASIIIKKDIFDEVMGFDEDYFLFYEEMDLCYRLKKLNYKIYYCPAQKLNHIGSVSVKKDYSFLTKNFYMSKMLFFQKQYGIIAGKTFIIIIYLQIFMQIILWSILFPLFKTKSILKIKGYFKVVTSRLNDTSSSISKNRLL
jgi:GT2 family glycosyltransferase